jgi:integrase
VQQLVDRFLLEYAPPRIKDIEAYRRQARTTFKARILPTFARRAAADVRALEVEQLRDAQLADGLSPASVINTLKFLGKLYAWAKKVGALDCANPASGIEQPRAVPSLDYLDAGEVGRLLAYAEEHAAELPVGIYPMIAVAVCAGLRKGELWGLRWRDLDLDAGRLTVARSYTTLPKSGKVRHVPLHPDLDPILRRWRDACPTTPEGLVFPVERPILRAFTMGKPDDGLGLGDDVDFKTKEPRRGILHAAGCHVPARPWHALRHTFASHFMMSGGNILTLQKLLGHADLKMTLLYAHLAPDFMKAEVARIAFVRPHDADVADLAEARRQRAEVATE